LQAEKDDSRIVQDIRTSHVKGEITRKICWIDNQVRYGHAAQAQVDTGRLPVRLEKVRASEFIGNSWQRFDASTRPDRDATIPRASGKG